MKRELKYAVLSVVLLTVFAAAVVARDTGGLDELAGTWFCQEYDGLQYITTRVTWRPDGTVTCSGPEVGANTTAGPFKVVRKWTGTDGTVVLRLAGDLAGRPCYLLLRISADGRCCEGLPDSSLAGLPAESLPGLTGYRVLVR